MNTASLKTLGWVSAVGETKFYRCDQSQIVSLENRQNVFSCGPCHERLLVGLTGGKVLETALVDLKVCLKELCVKHVGKIVVIRNVATHSPGLSFLARRQNWSKIARQESQRVAVVSDGSAVPELGSDKRHERKEKGQRMSTVVCCRLHLGLQLAGVVQDSIQSPNVVQHYYVCLKWMRACVGTVTVLNYNLSLTNGIQGVVEVEAAVVALFVTADERGMEEYWPDREDKCAGVMVDGSFGTPWDGVEPR